MQMIYLGENMQKLILMVSLFAIGVNAYAQSRTHIGPFREDGCTIVIDIAPPSQDNVTAFAFFFGLPGYDRYFPTRSQEEGMVGDLLRWLKAYNISLKKDQLIIAAVSQRMGNQQQVMMVLVLITEDGSINPNKMEFYNQIKYVQ